jgi:ornithine cyclodeaminase/alanine dehydrogenase-like protein (mu-crystallin family)
MGNANCITAKENLILKLIKNLDHHYWNHTLIPVLQEVSSLYNGKLVTGIGSFDRNMREFPKSFFEGFDYYYVDSEQGKVECGDIIEP